MTGWVFYVEVPGFYAWVERAADPALARRPVIVGGDPRKGGLVQGATPDATAAGVTPGMPVLDALERCPNARALRTDMRRYREASARLLASLRRECGRLEEAGLGAAYFQEPARPPSPAQRATALRERVAADLSLPLRVGIAPSKFVARLAAEEAGDEGIRHVGVEEVVSFLHPLPVARLDGVGPHTLAVLSERGVRTVGDLAARGRGELLTLLGNRGLELFALASGRDDSPVRASRHSNSLSQEITLPGPQVDTGVLAEHLSELAESLEKRLALENLTARRVALKLRYADHTRATRSHTRRDPIHSAAEIHQAALALLRRTQAGARPVRLVGIAVAELAPARREDRQLELFPRPG